MTHDFALEIGTEEIPAGYLRPAADHLRTLLTEGLAERRLAVRAVSIHYTPRRLIAMLQGVAARQDDLSKQVMGPPSKAAFGPDGKLTKAGEGFARGQGVAPEALVRVETPKGEYVAANVHVVGRPAPEVLCEWLPSVILSIPFPKTMKWRGETPRFARPIRWIVALLDAEVLPLTVEHLAAGRASRGHRLFTSEPVMIESASSILAQLEKVGVMADPAARRARVETELARVAGSGGARIVADADLVDEVTNLVEYPTAVIGSFDQEYLRLPAEVVITAMKAHQRYFAVEGNDGALRPSFIAIANGRWDDTAQVVAGNQRVLRARLADARFYWDADRKVGLEGKLDELKSVVWMEGAGSLFDRVTRIEAMTAWLGKNIRAAGNAVADADSLKTAARVAHLAKADLATDMIRDGKEFTGLQGVIGGRYAEAGGEPKEVVTGISEHYQPKGPSDSLPSTVPGLLVSLADRLDLIAGCFAMGLIPSGSQDPYALRRAANGLVRILMEKDWHLSLRAAIHESISNLPPSALARAGSGPDTLRDRILDFLRDRLDYALREAGLPYDVVAATLAAQADDPVDARARAQALAAIRGEPDLEKLVVGYKRAANILKGVERIPSLAPGMFDSAEPVEKALVRAFKEHGQAASPDSRRLDYPATVRALLAFRGPIDDFFEGVMVNSTDPRERDRRLGLLGEIRTLFDRFYDLSKIVVEG